jgi:hypothetical protein
MPNKTPNRSEQISLFLKDEPRADRRRGIRLWLKPAYGNQKSVWVIRDSNGNKTISTGYREHQRAAAGIALVQYIAKKEARENPPPKQTIATIDMRFYEARRRAEKAGKPFDLTQDFLRKLLDAQGGCCALTGIPMEEPKRGRNNPFVLSLDRIDSRGGYTQDNVRLVIFAMNAALGPWGEDVFYRIAAAYLERINRQKAA